MLPDFRVRQRDYLLEISRSFAQELDLGKLLARLLDISVEMLAGQAGLVALRAEAGGWTVAAIHGIPPALLRQMDALLATVPDHDDPARFELPEINRLIQALTEQVSLGLLTGVGLPLIARQRMVGVIFVFRSYAGLFSANDRALLQSFADQAAIAVQNAQLYTQLSRQKQRMDAILDAAADGMLVLNANKTVERCNPAFARMLGRPARDLQGQHHDAFIRLSRVQEGMTLDKAEAGGWPLAPNATLYLEADLERPNGPALPVSIYYAALVGGEGRLLNIIMTVRDISRFRAAEDMKTTFISVISHELKTPVALIKGYVGTLRRDDVSWDSSVVQDSLEVIEEEADRLTGLIENLLDASRLQAGALKINLAEVQLNLLAEETAARFRTQTTQHTIRVDFPPAFPLVLADEDRLVQVLSNLVSNAIKYSPQGGEICISGQARPDTVVVSVSDQGSGVSPEDMPHIFDRFYRSPDAVRKTKGAGLGLFLSKAVVEAHGGRLWLEPQPGPGARLCFSLPRPE